MTIIENASTEEDEPGSCTNAGDDIGAVPEAQPTSHVRVPGQVSTITVTDGGQCLIAVDRRWLRDRLQAAAERIRGPVARISVLLTDDARMIDLHRRHRGQAETTDVLSFPESAHGEPVNADIAVNVDEAARQAKARLHSTEQELLLYALHGVLHCAGFDDHDEESARAMHLEEDRILDAIGVGRTYAHDADATTGAGPPSGAVDDSEESPS